MIPYVFFYLLVFHNPVPPLDEALKQIQESNLKSEVNIPLSHRPATNWR